MKGKNGIATRICNIIAAVLLLAIIVCQFMPCWTVKDETLSIGEYVWHPYDHKDVTKYFAKTLDTELDSGSIAGVHIVFALGGIIAAVYCVSKSANVLPSILCAAIGIYGVISLNGNPILKAGSQWMTLMILSGLVILAAVAAIVTKILQKK